MRLRDERQARLTNIAYGITFVLLALLGGWWTVLIERLVDENHALTLALVGPTVEVAEAYTRKRVMLLGESVTLTVLALTLAGLVVRYARHERNQMRRLEGVLAASTHELKTPIAAVKALLESLESGVLPPEKMGPYLKKGLDSADRLEHLVEAILAWQVAVARPGRDVEARPLGAWVDAVLDHRLGTEENVTPDMGPAADVVVKAAPDAFRVVLENLLDNARKYGGASVRIQARVEERRVALDVVDEGVGFEPRMADAIFEPYQRGERVEKRHGTGLGLYIARTLARSIGGELEARSDGEGKGATFTFWLARE